MNTSTYFWSLVGSNLLVYIIFLLSPSLSSTNTYMGVLLESDYRKSQEIKLIAKNFRLKTTLVFVLGLILNILLLFISPDAQNSLFIAFILLLQTALYLVCFAQGNKKVLLYKKSLNLEEHYVGKVLIDTQFMQQKNKIKIIYKRLLLIPLGIAILLFVYSLVHYHQMPELIPTHFNLMGIPDGWAKKNLVSAFFPPAFLILMIIIFAGTLNTTFAARNTLSKDYLEESKTLVLAYLNGIARSICLMVFAITLLMTGTVIATVNDTSLNPFFNGTAIILLIVSFILMLYASKHYKAKLPKTKGTAPTLSLEDQDEYWIWGMIYNNPSDPALWVSKRHGMGWTINFGTLGGKLIALATVILLVLVIIFSM